MKCCLRGTTPLRRLHEGPAVTFNGERVIVAQALLWPGADDLPEG
jgi:hypothetical protein